MPSTEQRQRLYFSAAGDVVFASDQARPLVGGDRVDIVAYGPIEQPKFTIAWPPDLETQLNVTGYADALESALNVALSDDLHFRVTSLPGRALLKISAWVDRRLRTDAKDALDLLVLLRVYEKAGELSRIYEQENDIGESLGRDPELMGAHLMGVDARRLASEETRAQVGGTLSSAELRPKMEKDMARGLAGRDDALRFVERLVGTFARGFGIPPG